MKISSLNVLSILNLLVSARWLEFQF